jgi:hypothetical protein
MRVRTPSSVAAGSSFDPTFHYIHDLTDADLSGLSASDVR